MQYISTPIFWRDRRGRWQQGRDAADADAKEEASVLFGRSSSVLYWVTDLDVVLRKQEWKHVPYCSLDGASKISSNLLHCHEVAKLS